MIIAWLFGAADAITCYAPGQLRDLANQFKLNRERLHFLPLGVDTQFFQHSNGQTRAEPGLIASVGTNEGKDFPTLLAALPVGCRLEIVTDQINSAVIEKSPKAASPVFVAQNVHIRALRELYKRASVHVIPLRESRVSSGQTVLLENMAVGRPVIVTRTSATEAYVQDQVTGIMVEAGNVVEMRRALDRLVSDSPERERLGRAAAADVRERFSSLGTTRLLVEILKSIVQQRF